MNIAVPGALARSGAPSPRDSIHNLLEPKSIVLIGASADPTKLGSSPITAMQTLGYQGTIHVENPKFSELLGHPCYPSIEALPDGIDAAMIIVPAEPAIEAAEACAARGIKSIVMIPQGFGESGPEGLVRDRRLLALADQGIAITGPNTNGVANVAIGMGMSIGPVLLFKDLVKPGRIGIVSQSGAMVSSIVTKLAGCGLGIGKMITCGNELVLGVADYLDYLADDDQTDVVILYLETIRDLESFKAALARTRAKSKPVIAIKVGESESGQKATLSHTGAIAGSYRNTVAFLESEGVYVAEDLETLAILTECLVRYDWSDEDEPAKPFIASISGGFAAMAADEMERLGMPLQDPSPSGAAALSALPTQSHPVNPYDIASQNPLIPRIIEIFREDGFNQLLFGLVLLKPEINEQVTAMLIEAKRTGMKRLFALSPRIDPAQQERLNDANILLTDNTTALLKALRAIEDHRRVARVRRDAQLNAPQRVASSAGVALPDRAGLMDEAQSKRFAEGIGIRIPQSVVFNVKDGLGDHAHLRAPLVMKGLSDKIAHKSEHGLVALSLTSATDVEPAWERISKALATADPDADSILLEEMIGSGMEAILGVQRDATVGPVVLVGAGGILVELLNDAVVLVPPFSVEEVKLALQKTRFVKLLSGYRGRRYDMDALAQAAVRLGDLSLEWPRIEAIDLNPVLVQPDQGGLIAVDAKIFVTS